ncbi:hypothetical protein FBU30_008062 [Linnemannia zychae]|nr:hypothetical protein FBU30_008062 [Linnemannia zychae]
MHSNNVNNQCYDDQQYNIRRSSSSVLSHEEGPIASQSEKQGLSPQRIKPPGTAFAEGLPIRRVGATNNRVPRNPVVKSFGLRHKATMDWGMRARARTQKHWDKYWRQLETRQDTAFDDLYNIAEIDMRENAGTENGQPGNEPLISNSNSTSTSPITFSPCVLDLNCGPIILWLPGESPLHPLFLRRGLAFELANATGGLLVGLEHRFYGNSIPRFQDSSRSHRNNPIPFDNRQRKQNLSSYPLPPLDALLESEYPVLLHNIISTEDNENIEQTEEVWISESQVPSTPSKKESTKSNSQINPDKTSRVQTKRHRHIVIKDGNQRIPRNDTSRSHGNCTKHKSNSSPIEREKEGLPLDLLKYLNVDQSIEDIARFIDLFPDLQPKFFSMKESMTQTVISKPRWILAGCSYGGNLAAWTRQRYPSKVFAVFASSAPVRSALDFFEYSTSQIDILGDRCAAQLGMARDFLDNALQTTDDFMQQMAIFDLKTKHQNNEKPKIPINSATATLRVQDRGELDMDPNLPKYHISNSLRTSNSTPVTDEEKARRQDAKLRVLTWFSPDFAREYAAEGEEIHAAGWIWWTVASAVQYNAVVTPNGVQPLKTAVDILCDAMDQEKPNENGQNNLSLLKPLKYTQALASWFKDQQYFTPTKHEDLQPSDLDPTSVQNLAGMAWLWQTCSELGYLQTAQPSTCCCPSLRKSTIFKAKIQTFTAGNIVRSGESSLTCPLRTYESNISSSMPTSSSTQTSSDEKSMEAESTMETGSECLPCRCYAGDAQRNESVFSRLLTLEAAWQECQFYFGSTHSPTHNLVRPAFPSPPSTSFEVDTTNIPNQPDDAESIGTTIYQQPEVLETSDRVNRSASAILSSDSRSTTRYDIKHEGALLTGYPDVEMNVNTKFHGWEIARDPCYSLRSAIYEAELENSPVSYSRDKNIPSTSYSGTSMADPSFQTLEDSLVSESSQDGVIDQKKTTMFQTTKRNSRKADWSLEDWLMDHPGGRYYFTNGEKDPWKELTLASSRALEYLSHPKARNFEAFDSNTAEINDRIRNKKQMSSNHAFSNDIDSSTVPIATVNVILSDSAEEEKEESTVKAMLSQNAMLEYETGDQIDTEESERLSGTSVYLHKIHKTRNANHFHHHYRRRHRHLHHHRKYPHKNDSHYHHQKNPVPTPNTRSTTDPCWPIQYPRRQNSLLKSTRSRRSDPIPTNHNEGSENGNNDSETIPIEDPDEDDYGDRTVMRIISDASHCQDILYESNDRNSVKLQKEREHVLKTFVRWIEIDNRRQQRAHERQKRAGAHIVAEDRQSADNIVAKI